ncbi:TetR/AcrR family transcriptional regulator [Nisaea sp.]|uniref:TetR/AcrR family transcriptional regulator n=1 Tax=Nisaea sp. TaxID=2024842 RepID=UPI003B52524D
MTEKERQIVDAACKLFTEQGYEVTSMDKVAAEANVSKRTVYSYFESKEHLFCTVMGGMCAGFGEPMPGDIDFSGGLRSVLIDSAMLIVGKVTDPDKQRLMRTVIGEVEQFPLIGQTFWKQGPGRMRDELANYFRLMQEEGLMKKSDPVLSASQFQGIVAGPFMIQTMFTGTCDWTREEALATIEDAVDDFLKMHAPD